MISTSLGEEISRSETVEADAQGFYENHGIAVKARKLVGDSRRQKVISSEYFLNLDRDKREHEELLYIVVNECVQIQIW